MGSRRWTPPSEPTIRRVLQHLDADRLDAKIGPWLLEHCPATGRAVSVDGKTLWRAHDAGQKPPYLLSAVLHQEGLVISQREVGEKTSYHIRHQDFDVIVTSTLSRLTSPLTNRSMR